MAQRPKLKLVGNPRAVDPAVAKEILERYTDTARLAIFIDKIEIDRTASKIVMTYSFDTEDYTSEIHGTRELAAPMIWDLLDLMLAQYDKRRDRARLALDIEVGELCGVDLRAG